MTTELAGPCEKADRIAAEYAHLYDWADSDALKLYFRVELLNDSLRAFAANVHEAIMPGAKGWSVAVLRALYMAPQHRLSHAGIATQTRVPAANVTYHVDVLQQEGYVRRIPHDTDRRVTLVELTTQGKAICEQIIPARAKFITSLAEVLSTEEKVQFNDFIARLQQAVTNERASEA